LSALETVLAHVDGWEPDIVIVNGDVVNRGPLSLACWQRVEQRIVQDGWRMTRGNHEEYVLAWESAERVLTPYQAEIFASSRWTHQQMAHALDGLRTLPFSESVRAPDGSELRAVHASMFNIQHGVLPWTTDDELRKIIDPAPDVFVTSHTHRFFTRSVDETLVINTGSVGCPLDGNPDTGYAQIVWQDGAWSAELVRLPYDRQRAENVFRASGFIEASGPIGLLMFREWVDARSHMPFWGKQFAPQAASGEISLEASVLTYLDTLTADDLSPV
jgi:predicted phosphodiesterase